MKALKFDRGDEEGVRHQRRIDMVKRLRPGCTVRIIERHIEDPKYPGSGKNYTLTKLATWNSPNSDGIKLVRNWKDNHKKEAYQKEYMSVRGPIILAGREAFVIAVLPDVPCDLIPSRPWALLMTQEGLLGWCYALDALQLVDSCR